MTRDYMLQVLNQLPFAYVDPKSEWDDIGFTEREIWVNKKGYGYLAGDEPNASWECNNVDVDLCQRIKSKIANKTLSYADIKGTIFCELLEKLYYSDCDFDDSEQIIRDLNGLLYIDNVSERYLGAIDTAFGVMFFSTQDDFKKAYERDWVDVCWKELADDVLAKWLERLSTIDEPSLVEWAKNF